MYRFCFRYIFSSLRLFLVSGFLGLFLSFPSPAIALTTPFRSAAIITTDVGNPYNVYTNLANCSATDGLTCDRASGLYYANIYFRDFGTYEDFGMPQDATISKVRMRVTGKANVSMYVALSRGTTFFDNCQFPSDLWTLSLLNSQTIKMQTFVTPVTSPFVPQSVNGSCLRPTNFQNKNFIWKINYANNINWSASIDNFEIAFDYDPPPPPTPTPTLTPTPTPLPGPAPFLDLPWDYEGKGQTFTDAALSISSFFDHEYPLLSAGYSLSEPSEALETVISFQNTLRDSTLFYSRHDGYDYARLANVHMGDAVLAAAAGEATYVNSCSPCGNMIVIDHGNGYQTRYLHMQKEGLVTNIPGQTVHVNAHQQIGKVGATGKVFPSGDEGAHIHFGLVEDKNSDGNFEDNIPDGMTDPFGWQSKENDPWENYAFTYGGIQRTGNKSYYLWKKRLATAHAAVPQSGGDVTSNHVSLSFGSLLQAILVDISPIPITQPSATLRSVGTGANITVTDTSGNPITQFLSPFTLGVDFASLDLSNFNLDTLSIYSSSDGISWNKEPTQIDLINRTASTQVNHLTEFALMAELLDTTPPNTEAIFTGQQGEDNWFRSDVDVSLEATDNDGGLGVDYTMYKIGDADWEIYATPLHFIDEGNYTVEFYSVDNGDNKESIQQVHFTIDKTPPEAEVYLNTQTNIFAILGVDTSGIPTVTEQALSRNKTQVTIQDIAGNMITIVGRKATVLTLSSLSLESLQYNDDPVRILDQNVFVTTVRLDAQKKVIAISQLFTMKSNNLLGTMYQAKADNTKVYTYDRNNKQFLKETLVGLRLLKLITERGTLTYSY